MWRHPLRMLQSAARNAELSLSRLPTIKRRTFRLWCGGPKQLGGNDRLTSDLFGSCLQRRHSDKKFLRKMRQPLVCNERSYVGFHVHPFCNL